MVAAIGAQFYLRETLRPMVEIAFACEVVVEAKHARNAAACRQFGKDLFRRGPVAQPFVEGVARRHPSGEQIEGEPAPLILMIRLILQPLGRESLADVLGGDEL